MIRSLKTADYVVVGAGLAGCAVAARLSERPDVHVVLVEAGRENLYEPSYYATGAHAMWETEANWGFKTVPQAALDGARIDQPRGKVIGGSASINIGSWSRGIAADYDAWEAAGATGWTWSDALRVFRSIESSRRPETGPRDTEFPDTGLRGRDGPLFLEDTPTVSDMTMLLRQACIEAGYGATGDHNGAQIDGFDLWETIFFRGRRRNTAAAYLDPARSRQNLAIVTSALVLRIIVHDGAATGVEVEIDGVATTIKTTREVVLCAGAFGTPHLLMLSGIGPAAHLRQHGIDVVVDAAGVGTNLIDHLATKLGWAADGPGVIAPVYSDPKDPVQIEKWRRSGQGLLSANPNTSIAFIRSTDAVALPDVELLFGVNPPDDLATDPSVSGFTALVANIQPASRGEVRLATPDPRDAPLIDPRYLSDPTDHAVMLAGVRRAFALADTPSLKPYAVRRPLSSDATDNEIAGWIRDHAMSMYHPVSTVRMGDETAPLDAELRVRGVARLRVLDASAFPYTIRGHTMAPTLYVAERGSELIRSASS